MGTNPYYNDSVYQSDIIAKVNSLERYGIECVADDIWKPLGEHCDKIATDIEAKLEDLTGEGGWKGKAADAFVEEVQKVSDYAKELAGKIKTGDNSYWNLLKAIAEEAKDIQLDNRKTRLPDPPWFDGMSYAVDYSYVFGNEYDHVYWFYKTSEGRDKARSKVYKEDKDDAHEWTALLDSIPISYHRDGEEIDWIDDGQPFRKWEALYEKAKVNDNEKYACAESAQKLDELMKNTEFPEKPEDPKFDFKPANPGGPGGPGGPGSGPGGPGSGPDTTTPKTPKTPDTDPPEPPKDPRDPKDPPEPPKDPRDPKDPKLPPNRDPKDPWLPPERDPWDPRGPGGGGSGGSGGGSGGSGGGGGSSIDTGTSTARTGPGSGGLGGGGLGGGGLGGGGLGGPGGGSGGPGTTLPNQPASIAASPSLPPGGLRGAGGAGGMMGGMMPMMGGGMGGQDGGQEQQRDTWLNEDEDVWGGNDEAPPPVLGGGF